MKTIKDGKIVEITQEEFDNLMEQANDSYNQGKSQNVEDFRKEIEEELGGK